MKYLGEENRVEVKIISERKIEYMRCDNCGKKIMPCKYHAKQNQYMHIHTWHNDWDNDSCESHEYHDYCVECAKKIVKEYIEEMDGTEELELKNKYLWTEEIYQHYDEEHPYLHCGYKLAEKDNK